MCVIVGVGVANSGEKYIHADQGVWGVRNINPYLTEGDSVVLPRRSKPVSNIPSMVYGNKSTENGYLFLDSKEREDLLLESPESEKVNKKHIKERGWSGGRTFFRKNVKE